VSAWKRARIWQEDGLELTTELVSGSYSQVLDGYGESCFPGDRQELIRSSYEVNYDFEILKVFEKVNANQNLHLDEKINAHYNNNLQGKYFALRGLVLKPNIDDIRQAPELSIIDVLTKAGATVTAYDPEVMPNVKAKI